MQKSDGESGSHSPVEQFDVEEDIFTAGNHVEVLSGQHNLFDLSGTGAQDDDCK